MSLAGSAVAVAMGYVFHGLLFGSSVLTQVRLLSADKRRQVFTRY